MKNKYIIGSLQVVAPSGWKDITASLNEDAHPFTLAKDDGAGALQFSIAEYRSGKNPTVTLADLEDLRRSLAIQRHLSGAFDEFVVNGKVMVSGGSYRADEDYVRIWYGSDGLNVVLVTYVSDWGMQGNEPKECDGIVGQLSFSSGSQS